MPAPPSSDQLRPLPSFWPPPGLHSYGSTNKQPPPMLAGTLYTGLEASVRPVRGYIPTPNLPSNGITSLRNSYAPITPLFGGSQGELTRAPLQEEVDSGPLVQPELETRRPSKPLSKLEHAKVEHTPENLLRIRRLSKREQLIILTDGGNTVESQLRVLDTIEMYPPDSNNTRVWAQVSMLLPSGKETIEYHCKAPGCDYREVKFQKARQHFVSCHVPEPCWGCPIEGCTHVGRYKRLDDLKHHHMVPFHGIDYTRNRKREPPAHLTNVSTAGPETSNPTNPSPYHPLDGPALTVAIPNQRYDEGPATFHDLSHAERGSMKARGTRLSVSAGPSQIGRGRSGRAGITSGTTSRHDQVKPSGAEASLSNLFYQDTSTSPMPAPFVQVYHDDLSPQSESHQRSLLSNYSGSPAYTGTTPAHSPAGPGFMYGQTSPAPLASPLDSNSPHPQSSTYYEVPTPNATHYGRTSMPNHPDPRGMSSPHRASTFSTQQAVLGLLHSLRQESNNDQANRAPDASRFGGGLGLTSPGTQSLTPRPHYQQWGQTGVSLQVNNPYNASPHSSPPTMVPTTSSSGYISPSHPSPHNLGALSSHQPNVLDQTHSPIHYAPPQRATGSTHGFIENGGYLSAQMFSNLPRTGIASPMQGTMYQDRFATPTLRDSTTTYQSSNFGWSPQSEYPQRTILSPNSEATVSSNSFLPSTSYSSISEETFNFLD